MAGKKSEDVVASPPLTVFHQENTYRNVSQFRAQLNAPDLLANSAVVYLVSHNPITGGGVLSFLRGLTSIRSREELACDRHHTPVKEVLVPLEKIQAVAKVRRDGES